MRKTRGEIAQTILQLRNSPNWLFRIKLSKADSTTKWSSFLISPTDNYLEIDSGPIAVREIEYIDIDIYEEVYVGRLIPIKKVNNLQLIEEGLFKNDIRFIKFDNFIRVLFTESS